MKSEFLNDVLLKNLDNKLNLLNDLRPLPEIAVRKIREQFNLEMIYNSNAFKVDIKNTESLLCFSDQFDDHAGESGAKQIEERLFDALLWFKKAA